MYGVCGLAELMGTGRPPPLSMTGENDLEIERTDLEILSGSGWQGGVEEAGG